MVLPPAQFKHDFTYLTEFIVKMDEQAIPSIWGLCTHFFVEFIKWFHTFYFGHSVWLIHSLYYMISAYPMCLMRKPFQTERNILKTIDELKKLFYYWYYRWNYLFYKFALKNNVISRAFFTICVTNLIYLFSFMKMSCRKKRDKRRDEQLESLSIIIAH